MLIFLHGPDTFRSRRALRELREKFIREIDPSGHDVVSLDGEKVTVAKLSEAIGANSMFSRRRFVEIDGLLKQKDETSLEYIYNYLKDQIKSDTIVVIIDESEVAPKVKKKKVASKATKTPRKQAGKIRQMLFDFLAGEKYSQEFKKLDQLEMSSWLKKETVGRGAVLTPDAAALLLALTGGDLWQIDQELDKMIAYTKGKEKLEAGVEVKIEAATVKELVRGVFQEKVFELTDAVAERNRARALKLLEEELFAGQPPEQVFSLVMRQFRILLEVRQAVESGIGQHDLAAELGLHPFVIQKSIVQARNFSLESLKNIFSSLVRLEYLFKTGQVDLIVGLNTLIAKL